MPRTPSTPSAAELLAKAVEFGVFVPVGLLEAVRSELPKLADRGRQTVEQRVLVGRFIATLIAQQARQRIESTFKSSRDATPTASRPSPARGGAADGSSADAPSDVRTGRQAPTTEREPEASAADLAIDHYESLSATQVVPLLAGLDADDLTAVEEFERAHRNRRTVLGRIEQLRSR